MKGGEMLKKSKPFMAVIFLQLGLAGMDVISKVALDRGMNNSVFITYRHAVATVFIAPFALILEKKVRPRMTMSIFAKIVLLSILEPVIDQNLYFLGMKYTTATFAASMYNILPAVTFLMACIFRLERVQMRSIQSQAKLLGTCTTIGGAMIMTLVRGPMIIQGWSNQTSIIHQTQRRKISLHDTIKGSVLISFSCFGCSSFMILQAITLKTYPAELSLTALVCLLGTIWNAIIGIIVEGANSSVWSIHFDVKLLAAAYSVRGSTRSINTLFLKNGEEVQGIFCSGLAYYVQGVVMQDKGPVFIAVFSPLCMVFVAVISFFILAEQVNLGRLIGSVIIVAGLYLVVWGKARDHDDSMIPGSIDEENGSIEKIELLDCNLAKQEAKEGNVEIIRPLTNERQ
ncbi:hypothetical protein V2J09_006702 [Rumex salicifolius]